MSSSRTLGVSAKTGGHSLNSNSVSGEDNQPRNRLMTVPRVIPNPISSSTRTAQFHNNNEEKVTLGHNVRPDGMQFNSLQTHQMGTSDEKLPDMRFGCNATTGCLSNDQVRSMVTRNISNQRVGYFLSSEIGGNIDARFQPKSNEWANNQNNENDSIQMDHFNDVVTDESFHTPVSNTIGRNQSIGFNNTAHFVSTNPIIRSNFIQTPPMARLYPFGVNPMPRFGSLSGLYGQSTDTASTGVNSHIALPTNNHAALFRQPRMSVIPSVATRDLNSSFSSQMAATHFSMRMPSANAFLPPPADYYSLHGATNYRNMNQCHPMAGQSISGCASAVNYLPNCSGVTTRSHATVQDPHRKRSEDVFIQASAKAMHGLPPRPRDLVNNKLSIQDAKSLSSRAHKGKGAPVQPALNAFLRANPQVRKAALQKIVVAAAAARVYAASKGKHHEPQTLSLQEPDIVDHIKCQGDDTLILLGEKCELCNIDLCLIPTGSSADHSDNPPISVVLPCGHHYHDTCFRQISGDSEQCPDPPCIFCTFPKYHNKA